MQPDLKEPLMQRSSTRKKLVYLALIAVGGSMPDDQDQWRQLGQAAGYSGHHDLAGFYGGRVPSMVRAGGRRELTSAGWERSRRSGTT
jgi:hypothetical protein